MSSSLKEILITNTTLFLQQFEKFRVNLDTN